jgi:uncharacterized sulfatase
MQQNGGSAGLLRGGKGMTYEGGMRVPAIFWWPGTIEAGSTTRDIGSTLDLFPTLAALAGGALPEVQLDSHDLSPVLLNRAASPRDTFFFYRGASIYAVRKGPWKAHFLTQGAYGDGESLVDREAQPLLFHLSHDPEERYDVASEYPEVVEQLRALRAAQIEAAPPAPSRFRERIESQDRPDWAK